MHKECRRGTVRKRRCCRCECVVYIPQHLFGVHRWKPLCEECATPDDTERCTKAAAEWRQFHTLSPLIEEELDAGDD
jgi:hypothetical protein